MVSESGTANVADRDADETSATLGDNGNVATEGTGVAPGPIYVNGAFLCERVLREEDGTLSAIRIVDRWTLTLDASEAPPEMPPLPVQLTALVMVKAPDERTAVLRIDHAAPSGQRSRGPELPFAFGGPTLGANVIADVSITATEIGLHWFEVTLDDTLITRTPLLVVYRAEETP